MNQGFILLHRQLEDWEWYKDNNVKSLFIHCLLKANHKPKKWQGYSIKKGQFITSLAKLSYETGLTVQNVRTALKKLESTNELTSKTTNKNTLITVVSYENYQSINTQPNKQLTNNQQTTNKQLTTTNNDNNENNDKNEKEIYRAFGHLSISVDEFEKLKQSYKVEHIDSVLDAIENYKKNNNYKSLYLTTKKWLAKEHGEKSILDSSNIPFEKIIL